MLLVFSGQPVSNELLNLAGVHELHVINMAILLPAHDHIRRNALIAHSFWVSLVIFTSLVHFVLNFGGREAIIALYFEWVNALALELSLFEPVVEGNMGYV